MKIDWSKILPHITAVVIFILLSAIYFNPQLQGKKLPMGDIISYEGMVHESSEFTKKTGEQTLWTNSMFGGMPTYQIGAAQKNNVSKFFEKISQLFMARPIGYFISGMVFFYIALILLGVNPWLSILGAIAFSFTTNNLVLFEAGHTSKIRALMVSSLIISGTILAYRKQLLLGATTFLIGLAINIYSNHFQMTFYLGLILGIYVIFELVQHIKEKRIKDFGIASGLLILCTLIAAGTAGSKLLTTYEFGADTMRGKPIIETKSSDAASSSETDGLEFNYAMNWSNGILDLFSSYIPGFVGGGSAEPISKNSALVKSLKGRANIDKGPLYWGGLPSTSGPIYFGAVMFFLFILGLFTVNDRVKWWLLIAVILTFMFSMGKNLEWFNKLFFDYFPMFNKFRTPNSVLSITSILIPFLGILGLHQLFQSQEKIRLIQKLYIAGGVLLATCLVFAVLGSSIFDFNGANDARYGQMGYDVDAIVKDRKSLLFKDSLRSFLFIALSAGLIWMYLKNKIGKIYVIIGLSILTLIDLWGVDKRYLNSDDFEDERAINQTYQPRNVDQAILKDTDIHYRVHDVSGDPFNSSFASYFHKTIGGYNPAKLQRAQDLIDYHFSKGNLSVFNMFNTKYFITSNQEGQLNFQVNINALGNAWFVDSVILLKTNLEEINGLSGFDPSSKALVNREFEKYFDGWNIEKPENARIQLTEYAPNKLTYTTTGNGNKFAVFSEMWYGPNKGWQAYLDGEPVEHIRVNYALRAMKVPAGSHEIIFKFDPQTYKTGELISLICSVILVLLLGLFIYFEKFRKKKTV